MNRFEKVVRKHGEDLTLHDGSARLPFRASLKESTHATYSMNNRANYFEGQSLKRTLDDTGTAVALGHYVTRLCDPDVPYMVASTLPEPLSGDSLIYLYMMRCNERVTIDRWTEDVDPDNPSEIISGWVPVAADAWCNKDIVTRSMKGTNDGLLDQAIYILALPRSIGVKVLDRVKMAGTSYRVESINDIIANANLTAGLDVLQLTYYDEHEAHEAQGGD